MLAAQSAVPAVGEHSRLAGSDGYDPVKGSPAEAGDAELEAESGKYEWQGADVWYRGELRICASSY